MVLKARVQHKANEMSFHRMALSLISRFGEGQVKLKGDGGKEEEERGWKVVKNKMYTFLIICYILEKVY